MGINLKLTRKQNGVTVEMAKQHARVEPVIIRAGGTREETEECIRTRKKGIC